MAGRVEQIGDATLYLGDCLEILPTLDSVDALVTDPPYSSGGQFRGDRTQATSLKYVQSDSEWTCRAEFSGDNRDQRAFLAWSSIWFGYALRASNPGAVALVFTDWRQLPTMSDALQCGGWVWAQYRHLVEARHSDAARWFSGSAEYVLYASSGPPVEGERSPQNVLSFAPVGGENKEHIAEKPVELLTTLLGVTKVGSVILDPFMGSGTTGVACLRLGRKFVGIEIDPAHFGVACRRIEQEARQGRLELAEPKPAYSPEQDSLLSYNAAVQEIGRRVKAGEERPQHRIFRERQMSEPIPAWEMQPVEVSYGQVVQASCSWAVPGIGWIPVGSRGVVVHVYERHDDDVPYYEVEFSPPFHCVETVRVDQIVPAVEKAK